MGWLMVALITLAGCGRSESATLPTVSPTHTPTPVNQELIIYAPDGGKRIFNVVKTYLQQNALPYNIKIMEGVTTELTMQGLKEGAFDMIFMYRLPKPNEGIELFELFRAQVAIFTHPDVGVDDLSSEQIAAIFSGEVTNWSEVGGRDQPIVLFILPEYDSVTEALRTVVIGDRPFSAPAQRFPSETAVLLAATGVPGGIGYATWTTKKYLEFVNPGGEDREFHAIAIDGTSVNDPDYPLKIVIGFGYLPEQEAFLTPAFEWMDSFLRSSAGQQLLGLFDIKAADIR